MLANIFKPYFTAVQLLRQLPIYRCHKTRDYSLFLALPSPHQATTWSIRAPWLNPRM
jgi:hypothetical protein